MIATQNHRSRRKALVVGLGISGMAAARFLQLQGWDVACSDLRTADELNEVLPALAEAGITEIENGGHSKEFFLERDLIVVSPGVPLSLPVFKEARKGGCQIIGEVELAARHCRCPLLGLTGTNGKTTTVTLMGEIFRAAGINPFIGGNLGRPALEMVETEFGVGILELSSFQLEGIATFHPRIATILNLTPDHQDRYANPKAYLEAKVAISKNQGRADFLLLNQDDPELAALGSDLKIRHEAGDSIPQVLFFSIEQEVTSGASWLAEKITVKAQSLKGHRITREIIAPTIKLPGTHNRSNYLAALLAAMIWGINDDIIIKTLRDFKGIAHRLEYVGNRSGVDFYNDSKATNIDAVSKALTSFDKPLVLLLGGYDKGADFATLEGLFKKNLREIIPFGGAAEKVCQQLPTCNRGFRAPDLKSAVERALQVAKNGDVVLLAPGCASFDEFTNYQERGDTFRKLVHKAGASLNGQL